MKKILSIIFISILVLSFVACKSDFEATLKENLDALTSMITPSVEPTIEVNLTPTVEPTIEVNLTPTVEPTIEPTIEPTPTVTPTVAPTATPVPDKSYKIKVHRADFPIYKGPGYNYSYVGIVEIATNYTIVDEATDAEGDLWGKLKSGAGWINLTLLETEKNNRPPISVKELTKMPETCHHYVADTPNYIVKMILRTEKTVTNLSLFSVDYSEYFKKDKVLFSIEKWVPEKPIVAELSFPGDFTTYGIEFTDESGKKHTYGIGESGEDGSLYLWEEK